MIKAIILSIHHMIKVIILSIHHRIINQETMINTIKIMYLLLLNLTVMMRLILIMTTLKKIILNPHYHQNPNHLVRIRTMLILTMMPPVVIKYLTKTHLVIITRMNLSIMMNNLIRLH